MVIEMSCDSGVMLIFDIVKVCAKSSDNRIFCFAYILYATYVARNGIYQVTTLAVGFDHSSIGSAILNVGNCPTVTHSWTIPTSAFPIASLAFQFAFILLSPKSGGKISRLSNFIDIHD